MTNLQGNIHNTLAPLLADSDSVALFDFPKHDNVGDLAIWWGEVHFLQAVLGKKIVAVENCMAQDLPSLDRSIPILLHGGGNLGDIWPDHERFRRRVIATYPENRIVILPQTLHFTTPEALNASAEAMGERHSNRRSNIDGDCSDHSGDYSEEDADGGTGAGGTPVKDDASLVGSSRPEAQQ